jgi:hypothetical protein
MDRELLSLSNALALSDRIVKWTEQQMTSLGDCGVPISLISDIFIRIDIALANYKASYHDFSGIDLTLFLSQVGMPF